jgi:hypothetical protein
MLDKPLKHKHFAFCHVVASMTEWSVSAGRRIAAEHPKRGPCQDGLGVSRDGHVTLHERRKKPHVKCLRRAAHLKSNVANWPHDSQMIVLDDESACLDSLAGGPFLLAPNVRMR